jgi:hypothetical protein
VTWLGDELWTSAGDGTLKRWQVRDGGLALQHNVLAAATFHLTRVVRGGWAATTGEGVLLVSLDGASVALRLDIGRSVDTLDVSPDLRYVAAGVNGEIVVVDMQRNAIATPTIGAPVTQQISFLDSTSLAFSEPTALKTLQIDHLDYVPFQAVPEP